MYIQKRDDEVTWVWKSSMYLSLIEPKKSLIYFWTPAYYFDNNKILASLID